MLGIIIFAGVRLQSKKPADFILFLNISVLVGNV